MRGSDEIRQNDQGNAPIDQDKVSLGRRNLLRGGVAASLAVVGNALRTSPVQANIWEEGEVQCHASAAEKDPGYDLDDALLADFMAVSRTLTGMPLTALADLRLGREYLERFARIDVAGIDARKLIAAHASSAEAIMGNGEVRPAAEQLIYLWYLSAFFLPTAAGPAWVYGTTEQYERGLLWKIIGAHAPMVPMRDADPNYWAEPGHLPKVGTHVASNS